MRTLTIFVFILIIFYANETAAEPDVTWINFPVSNQSDKSPCYPYKVIFKKGLVVYIKTINCQLDDEAKKEIEKVFARYSDLFQKVTLDFEMKGGVKAGYCLVFKDKGGFLCEEVKPQLDEIVRVIKKIDEDIQKQIQKRGG